MVATREDVATKQEFKVVGTRPIRPDGTDKVTGRAIYGADIVLPGLLYGRVLRSPHAHARIKRIDTSKAEAHPGVKAVVTGADLPRIAAGTTFIGESFADARDLSEVVIAREKVYYKGQAVAAVAATSRQAAAEAVAKIEVEYEPLPVVLDVRQAMREDAPLLDETRRTKSMAGLGDKPSNIAQHLQLKSGDVEAGFAQADFTIEREFTTTMVHQGYIEPHTATAFWNADDAITVWTSTQGAFMIRDETAGLLEHPVHKIKVIPLEIGGGFGGKIHVYLEPLAAVLSKKSGRPVKLQMSRTEVFEASGPTSGTYMRLKLGVTNEGKILACEAFFAFEAGAFPGSNVASACMTMCGPYEIPNVLIDGYDVVVNKPKTAAYRAPGAPLGAYAMESIVDEIAERLGLDPLDLRLKNASKEGTRNARGTAFGRIGNIEVLEAAKNSDHYRSKLEPAPAGKLRGRGVANGFWFNGGMQSSLHAGINPDGTVSLVEGSTDIGGTRASIAMQLAETLGIPYESVKPTVVDTDSVGHNGITGGSRVTFATGWAAYECAMDLRRQLVERAAKIWEVPVEEVVYEDGGLRATSDDSKKMTFKEIAGKLHSTGAPVMGRGSVTPPGVGGAFCTQICDLEVDPDTGKVDILRYTVVQDAGKAVHPSYVEGQMQGGASQGIGWALNEEYFYLDNGLLANASFLDYRMPTTLDLPLIETVIVEVPNPGHPYGVRGVGEVPIVPPLATIANALYHATGKRFHDLPANPARILKELKGVE
jgi:CO/xanthine dehydrogenase Mo-binding subunit